MSDLIELYFVGFSCGLLPALFYFLVAFGFRTVTECAEIAAN